MDSEKAINGLNNFMDALGSGSMRQDRDKAMNTKVGDIMIDTVIPGDTNKWETGIKRNGKWIIVEQYKDINEAIKGHTKWVKKIEEDKDCKLKDINMWGLDDD